MHKYWTIAYPGERGQDITETFSEDQIIDSYYSSWANRMLERSLWDKISKERCIADWTTVHWAIQTDEQGNKL